MLNNLKDKIMCVRGNCDAEVDQMVLDFPIMAEYIIVVEKGKMIFATHGHKFGIDNLPPVGMGDILITGHTHVPACMPMQNIVYLNCGSVSIPKQNSKHTERQPPFRGRIFAPQPRFRSNYAIFFVITKKKKHFLARNNYTNHYLCKLGRAALRSRRPTLKQNNNEQYR